MTSAVVVMLSLRGRGRFVGCDSSGDKGKCGFSGDRGRGVLVASVGEGGGDSDWLVLFSGWFAFVNRPFSLLLCGICLIDSSR